MGSQMPRRRMYLWSTHSECNVNGIFLQVVLHFLLRCKGHNKEMLRESHVPI